MGDPEEITVIVHGARGLQGRKAGRHKYSVIFGLGTKKFRTAIVKEAFGNPDWNEESVIKVNATGDICFTVTEKDDPLGQISIQISSLRATKGQTIRAALQPHKKCIKPKGYLLYQCYVSCYKSSNDDAAPIINNVTQDGRPHSIGGFVKLKRNFKRSPVLTRAGPKKEGKQPSSLANFRGKLSRSFHDLFHLNYMTTNIDFDEDVQKTRSTYNLHETGNLPDVISITPNQVPISGGTMVTIEGKCLGFSKADILSLEICGCDCTDYVQYESPEVVHFTTRDWHAGNGDLLFETASGGQRLFPGTFTYVDKISSLPRDLGKVEITPDDSADQPIWMNSSNTSTLAVPGTTSDTSESEKKNSLNRTKSADPANKLKKRALYLKHTRHVSESATTLRDINRSLTKSELLIEVTRLQKDNEELHRDNKDMKIYIEKLVSRVLIQCPEALSAEGDKPPSGIKTK